MADTPEAINKSKRLYMLIGGTLFIFTIITVLVATVPWLDFGGHGFDIVDAIIGLAIAAFKASLVMLIFMHLNHEKKTIYFLYVMALIMAFFLMFLTGWGFEDPIHYGTPSIQEPDGGTDGFYVPPGME
ncbi:MAG: cytochrome C oxidase subunit IV family protein [Verrucomicrobiales bacterium]